LYQCDRSNTHQQRDRPINHLTQNTIAQPPKSTTRSPNHPHPKHDRPITHLTKHDRLNHPQKTRSPNHPHQKHDRPTTHKKRDRPISPQKHDRPTTHLKNTIAQSLTPKHDRPITHKKHDRPIIHLTKNNAIDFD